MPAAVNNGQGFPGIPIVGWMFGLGPYFNLFPVITLGLYLVQQKVMMPPAADEQAAQQQKIMKFFMIFIGFMFFKVAAGLCLYFIATTLWGLLERRFLPKVAAADGQTGERAASRLANRLFALKPERTNGAQRDALRRKKRKR